MARTASPLRYPGGKSCLYDLLTTILHENRLERGHYVEPYAGGCGLALSLLYGGHVSDIHINDLDTAIWSFWDCVLNRTEELVELIQNTPVTIKEWHRQKEIQRTPDTKAPLQLAFATFFLNRTNRSGIIKGAGMIGGLSQTGDYKLDCRFNRQELAQRIERIAKYRNRIHLTNSDAIPFMRQMQKRLPENTFFCIDPPYFNKGASLYTNYYDPIEHKKVADAVLKLNHPWIVTYDHAEEIKALYSTRRQFIFDINYSLQTKRIGSELLIASKGLRLPEEIRSRQTNRPQARAA
ncbi:MAG: DNA adenine methylase [Alphaproteobacteria bacterium]